jgi:hypothetical protein
MKIEEIKNEVDKVLYELENVEFNSIVAETNIYKLANIIYDMIGEGSCNVKIGCWDNYPVEEDSKLIGGAFTKAIEKYFVELYKVKDSDIYTIFQTML